MKHKILIFVFAFLLILQIQAQQSPQLPNHNIQFPKFIWIYNQEGSTQVSQIFNLFIKNIQRLTQQSQWKIVLLDENIAKLYVEDKQHFQTILQNKKKRHNEKNKIDLIKLEILHNNGGVWMDMPIILTESLQWLDSLNSNLDVFNRKYSDPSQHPQVFMFSNKQLGNNRIEKYWQQFQKVLPYSGYQTWFIAAFPKCSLLRDWKSQYTSYYSNDFDSYYHKNVNQNIYLRNLDLSREMAANAALQNVIQRKQHQLDSKVSTFGENRRQFSVHYYKLWTINSGQGPTKLHDISANNQKQYLKYILKRPSQLLRLNHKYPKYMIKMNQEEIKYFNSFFIKDSSNNALKFSEGIFFRFIRFNKISCQNNFLIIQNSIFDSLFWPLLQVQMQGSAFERINYHRFTQSCEDLKLIAQKSAFFGSFFGLLIGISLIMIWKLYLKESQTIELKKQTVIQFQQNQQQKELYNQEDEDNNQEEEEEFEDNENQEEVEEYDDNEQDQQYYEQQQEQQKVNDDMQEEHASKQVIEKQQQQLNNNASKNRENKVYYSRQYIGQQKIQQPPSKNKHKK